jgi:hypothetical protein
VACATVGLIGQVSNAAAIRVDQNGQLVGDNNTPGFGNGNVPPSWTVYGTGTGGGQAWRYDTGGSSNTFSVQNEDEDALRGSIPNDAGQVGVYPSGHSWTLGGNTTGTPSTWGLKQTISATAGKVYWISAAEGASADWSSGQVAKYAFDYGVETGTGQSNGMLSSGNIRRSSGGLQDGRFTHAVVATGNQVTAHVGLRSNAANPTQDINVFVDGIRVHEIDVPVNNDLVNGGFEGGSVDISQYNAKGIAGNGGVYAQQDLVDGWIPLGGAAAQRAKYNLDSTVKFAGNNSFQFDQFKGWGRMYAVQKVDGGGPGATYTLAGMVRNDTDATSATEGDTRIGIDPTGGLDPTSPNIIWSPATASLGTWTSVSVNGGNPVVDVSGNGVTLFLASGYNGLTTTRSANQSGGRFDNISLAIVAPEPTSIALLAFAGLPILGRRRRA